MRVVDTSAIAALVFGEPNAEEVEKRLGDATLAAPALLWFELASVALKKCALHPRQRAAVLRGLTLAQQLGIRSLEVDHLGVIALAEQTKLTTYDASYLWLARELGAELVTLDQALEKAALVGSKVWRKRPLGS